MSENNNAIKMLQIAATHAALLAPSLVNAFCYEPSAPSAPYGGPPDAPYCFNEWNKTHTCDSYEIDSWIDEVNDYIRDMANYAEEAQAYANEAVAFAQCQIDAAKEPFE